VRCKACRYSLKNLTEHRCPECGREFDPSDPNTFDPAGFAPQTSHVWALTAATYLAAWACAFIVVQTLPTSHPRLAVVVFASIAALALTAVILPFVLIPFALISNYIVRRSKARR
jgi:hypothetical protein